MSQDTPPYTSKAMGGKNHFEEDDRLHWPFFSTVRTKPRIIRARPSRAPAEHQQGHHVGDASYPEYELVWVTILPGR